MDATGTPAQSDNHNAYEIKWKLSTKELADRWYVFRQKLATHHELPVTGYWGEYAGIADLTDDIMAMAKNRAACVPGNLLMRQHVAFTCFVPGGKAERAHQAVLDLTANGMLLKRPASLTKSYTTQLARLIRPNVRFYYQKAQRLTAALKCVDTVCYNMAPVIQPAGLDPARITTFHDYWLQNMDGWGPKATAHLMRNLGFFTWDFGYPIIDVHILKALDAFNFRTDNYTVAETSFHKLAQLTGIPVLLLDGYLWCTYSNNWTRNTSDFGNFTSITLQEH